LCRRAFEAVLAEERPFLTKRKTKSKMAEIARRVEALS
jgi:hypothetical protein